MSHKMLSQLFCYIALLTPAMVITASNLPASDSSSTIIMTKLPSTTNIHATTYGYLTSCASSLNESCSGYMISSKTGILQTSGFPRTPAASQVTHFPISSGVFKLPHGNRTATGSIHSSQVSGSIPSITSQLQINSTDSITAIFTSSSPISPGFILPHFNKTAYISASSGSFLFTLIPTLSQIGSGISQNNQRTTSPMTVVNSYASDSFAPQVTSTNHLNPSTTSLSSSNKNNKNINEGNQYISSGGSDDLNSGFGTTNSPHSPHDVVRNSNPTSSGQMGSTGDNTVNKNNPPSSMTSSAPKSSWPLLSPIKSTENFLSSHDSSGRTTSNITRVSDIKGGPNTPLSEYKDQVTAGVGKVQQSVSMAIASIFLTILL